METQFIIYKIYWSGKGFYIGKTRGFRKRRNRHLREMQDGSHHNQNLIKMFARHGIPKIKKVVYAASDEELDLKEKQFLDMYKNNRRCLNRYFA